MRINVFFSFPIFFLLMAAAYIALRPVEHSDPTLPTTGNRALNPIHQDLSKPANLTMAIKASAKPRDASKSVDPRIFLVDRVLRNYHLERSVNDIWSLAQHIVDEADNVGVAPSLLLAVIMVESNFDPCAVSPVGAKGLMQVMPQRILGREKAATDFAFNHHLVYDPYWNISFGAAYLQELISRFGSVEMALSAYNRGPTRVSRQLRNRTYRSCGYARKVFALQEAFEQFTI